MTIKEIIKRGQSKEFLKEVKIDEFAPEVAG